ncbi:hypothetical protein [Dyella sp. C11]|nr:hypothetical protein [Dyella sp. C11]
MQRLSSRSVFFYKRGFPAFWLGLSDALFLEDVGCVGAVRGSKA